MKKKTTISNAVIVLIGAILFTICFMTYAFYMYSKKNIPVTKVKSDDYFSIDSIKRISVKDTVRYFQREIINLNKNNINKDSINKSLLYSNLKYEKIIDSLKAKVYYYREKSRWIKSKTDSVQ